MNAGVARNWAVSAGDVPYGASPYTASVSAPCEPGDAEATHSGANATTTAAATSPLPTPRSLRIARGRPLRGPPYVTGRREATGGRREARGSAAGAGYPALTPRWPAAELGAPQLRARKLAEFEDIGQRGVWGLSAAASDLRSGRDAHCGGSAASPATTAPARARWSMNSRSDRSAWWARDFAVPTGMPRWAAASRVVRSL